jgi:hypothetical protein
MIYRLCHIFWFVLSAKKYTTEPQPRGPPICIPTYRYNKLRVLAPRATQMHWLGGVSMLLLLQVP